MRQPLDYHTPTLLDRLTDLPLSIRICGWLAALAAAALSGYLMATP